MDFSVLMSVYKNDRADFLLRALESVTIHQSVRPAQVVLIQDGPVPDAIKSVVSQMKNRLAPTGIEFTVIKKEKNAGLAAALNTGLAYCKYEYVARMDSDDVSLPNRFKQEFAYLRDHPEISILGSIIAEFEFDEKNPIQLRIVPQEHEEIVDRLRTRNAMNHMSVVFKKEDILRLGGYCEDFGKLEDYKLWVDAVRAGLKLHNLNDICVNVRVGSGFIERRSNKREVQDWDRLQTYLLDAKLIGHLKAFVNKLSIRVFMYMPTRMKKIAYKMVLRKKNGL